MDFTLETVPVEKLKFAAFNPPSRVERDLQYLKDSIERYGFWKFRPIICDVNYVIADGHRRATVANMLKLEMVPVMRVKNIPLDDLWAYLNVTETVTPGQVMEAYSLGLNVVPPKQKRSIEHLEMIIGKDGIKHLVSSGKVSPAIYNTACRVANYCGRKGDIEFLGKAIFWMVDLKMQQAARQVLETNASSDLLVSAIEKKRPLVIGLSIA